MDASSVLEDSPLTNAADSECLDGLPPPSEPAEEARDLRLNSGLCWEAEPVPCGDRPSRSVKTSCSAARNRFMEPVGVPFLGIVLPLAHDSQGDSSSG